MYNNIDFLLLPTTATGHTEDADVIVCFHSEQMDACQRIKIKLLNRNKSMLTLMRSMFFDADVCVCLCSCLNGEKQFGTMEHYARPKNLKLNEKFRCDKESLTTQNVLYRKKA